MGANIRQKVLRCLISLLISLVIAAPGLAVNNPQLLPDRKTPVIDLARVFTPNQKDNLEKSLNDYEKNTGWKLRVLTQFEQTPGLAVKEYWDLDERSLLIIADPRGGNLLNFNVGDALFALMPRIFWVELQTRFGNQYYVRDNGEDRSIIDALDSVETCLDRGGCQVVPGLAKEQWIWTLSSSILGGIIAGISAFPRKQNQTIAWPWLLLLSPLWVMLFGVFGIAPVVTRTSEILPLIRNFVGFIGSALLGYLIAQATFGENQLEQSD